MLVSSAFHPPGGVESRVEAAVCTWSFDQTTGNLYLFPPNSPWLSQLRGCERFGSAFFYAFGVCMLRRSCSDLTPHVRYDPILPWRFFNTALDSFLEIRHMVCFAFKSKKTPRANYKQNMGSKYALDHLLVMYCFGLGVGKVIFTVKTVLFVGRTNRFQDQFFAPRSWSPWRLNFDGWTKQVIPHNIVHRHNTTVRLG